MNKLTYDFTLNKWGYPSMGINLEYEMIWELWSCSSKYIREIVSELKEVIKWEKSYYTFWYVATIITVVKKWFISPVDGRKHINGLVTISYDYWEGFLETEINIEDLYAMIKDWRDYVDAWEKETGKIKK